MPITYQPCGDDVLATCLRMTEKYHGELKEAGVTVTYLFANNDGDAAVKLNGYPCAAKIKIIGLKERADGRADAEVLIDQIEWQSLNDTERDALIDHELHHLELQLDKNNKVKRDDLGRPKLSMRKHDHQFGWFDSIARRHGDASYEVKQAKAFADEAGQTYFGWKTPPSDGIESLPAGAKKSKPSVSDEWAAAQKPPMAKTDEPKNVTTKDGRKIGVTQMLGEIETAFKH